MRFLSTVICTCCCLSSWSAEGDPQSQWAAMTPTAHDDYMVINDPHRWAERLLNWQPMAEVTASMPMMGGAAKLESMRQGLAAGKENWPTFVAMSADSGSYEGGGALLSLVFMMAWADGFEGLTVEERDAVRPQFDQATRTILTSSRLPDLQIWIGSRNAMTAQQMLQGPFGFMTMFAQESDTQQWFGAGRARFVFHGAALLERFGFSEFDLRSMLVEMGICENLADPHCDQMVAGLQGLRLAIELRAGEQAAIIRINGPDEADPLGNEALAALVIRPQDLLLMSLNSKAVLDGFGELDRFAAAIKGSRFEAQALARDGEDVLGSWQRSERQYFGRQEDRMDAVLEIDGDCVLRVDLQGSGPIDGLRARGFDRFLPPKDGPAYCCFADMSAYFGDMLGDMTSSVDEKLVEKHDEEMSRREMMGAMASVGPTALEIFRGRFGDLRRLLLDGLPGVFDRGWMFIGRCSEAQPAFRFRLPDGRRIEISDARLPEMLGIARLADDSAVIETLSRLLQLGGAPALSPVELPGVGAAWAFPLAIDGQELVEPVGTVFRPHVVVRDGFLMLSTSPALTADILADNDRQELPEGPIYAWGQAGADFMSDARSLCDDWLLAMDPQTGRLQCWQGERQQSEVERRSWQQYAVSVAAGARWALEYGFLCREAEMIVRGEEAGWQTELRLQPVSESLPEIPLPAFLKAMQGMRKPIFRQGPNGPMVIPPGGGNPVPLP